MRIVFALAFLVAGAAAAKAAGGLICSAEGDLVTIDLQAGMARDVGSPLFQIQGVITAKDQQIPADLRDAMLNDAHQRQYWFDEKELRLIFYRVIREKAYGSVRLDIRAQAKARDADSTPYAGRYELTLSDSSQTSAGQGKEIQFSGAIECFAD